MTNWINKTTIEFNTEDYLGFIYRITHEKTKTFYIGRKQFWTKKGRNWYESDWRDYKSSSKQLLNDIREHGEHEFTFEILAIFTSKSAIRYAEAASIILSGAYINKSNPYNWSFEGSRGQVRLIGTDREQLKHLFEQVFDNEKTVLY